MKTKEMNFKTVKRFFSVLFVTAMLFFVSAPAFAHCDSYDGPVIKDAVKAFETNNVTLVYKWITAEQEKEIGDLFNKTYNLKKGDKEIYSIVEKHFSGNAGKAASRNGRRALHRIKTCRNHQTNSGAKR